MDPDSKSGHDTIDSVNNSTPAEEVLTTPGHDTIDSVSNNTPAKELLCTSGHDTTDTPAEEMVCMNGSPLVVLVDTLTKVTTISDRIFQGLPPKQYMPVPPMLVLKVRCHLGKVFFAPDTVKLTADECKVWDPGGSTSSV